MGESQVGEADEPIRVFMFPYFPFHPIQGVTAKMGSWNSRSKSVYSLRRLSIRSAPTARIRPTITPTANPAAPSLTGLGETGDLGI